MGMEDDFLKQYGGNTVEKYAQKVDAEAQEQASQDLLNTFAPPEEPKFKGQDPEVAGFMEKVQSQFKEDHPAAAGALEATKGFGKGILSAIEQTGNFALDAADALENSLAKMGVGSGNLLDDNSRINVIEKMFADPATPAEHAGKILGQYLAPLGVVNKVVKAGGWIGGVQKVAMSSGITSLISDPDDQRLSDLVQAYPALANPVAEYLAHDEDDPKLLSRFKTGVESALVDAATLGLAEIGTTVFKTIRAGKEVRKIKKLQKLEKADPVPGSGPIDESTIQKTEEQIAENLEKEAKAQSKAKPTGKEGEAKPAPKVTGDEVKAQVKPQLPKDPPPTPEEVEMLRKAEAKFGVKSSKEFRVHRQDIEGFNPLEDKPHGLYVSIVDDPKKFKSPHSDAGPASFEGTARPKNALELEPTKVGHASRKTPSGGEVDASAGVAALKKLVDPDKFEALRNASKEDLVAILNKEFPGGDYAKYHDSYELLEVYGAKVAKSKGYDALILRDPLDSNFSEAVILDTKAVDWKNPPKGPAKNIPELVKEYKAAGRPIVADDLHEVARRGTVTDEQNKKLAKEIMEKEGEVEELINRQFGTSLNQEELTSMKYEYLKRMLEVDNVLKGSLSKIDDLSEADLVVIQERLDSLEALDASIKAGNSEAGRALRSAKNKAMDLLEEGDDAVKIRKVREYLKIHGGTDSVKETLKQIKQIQDSKFSVYDVLKQKANSVGTKFSDAAFEFWINNVLSGPSTLLITNPLSNFVSALGGAAESAVASGYGAIYRKAQEKLYGKVINSGAHSGETFAQFAGFVEAFEEAVLSAKQVFKGQMPGVRSQFLMPRARAISAEAFGADPMSLVGRFLDVSGSIINIPTRVLSAQDVFFNVMNQRARRHQLAHRFALQTGHEVGSPKYIQMVEQLKRNPTPSMMKESRRYGEEFTLTSALGAEQGIGVGNIKFGGQELAKLQRFMESVPLGRYAGAFMRVGTNLADRAIQRTPISFLRPETRARLFAGSAATAQEEIAKMTVGTGILFAGGLMAHHGFLTGSGPDDPKMQKALKGSGFQQYSISTPGGGKIKTKDLGPLGIVLNISADLAELTGRIDADDAERAHLTDELIIAASTILTSSMTPEFLQNGVPDFFTFIKDIAQGRRSKEDIAESVGRFSTGFMPASGFLRQMGQIIDPEMRDANIEPDASFIEATWGRVKNEWLKVAGLDGYAGLPPELNIFGEEVVSPLGVGSAIKSAIFSNNPDENDFVTKELIRLDSTGALIHVESPDEEAFSIRMPERTKRKGIGFGSGVTVPIRLDPHQYHDYVKLSAGHKVGDLTIAHKVGPLTLKEALAKVIKSEGYKNASDTARKIELKKVVSTYKSAAWQVMMMKPDAMEEFKSRRANRLKSIFGKDL